MLEGASLTLGEASLTLGEGSLTPRGGVVGKRANGRETPGMMGGVALM